MSSLVSLAHATPASRDARFGCGHVGSMLPHPTRVRAYIQPRGWTDNPVDGLSRQAHSEGQLLLDPSTHEERQAEAMLSVAITSAGNQVTHLTANGAWPPARLSQVRTGVAESCPRCGRDARPCVLSLSC